MSEEKWIVKWWNETQKGSVKYRRRIDAYRRLEVEFNGGLWSNVGVEDPNGEMVYERSRQV